MRLFVGIPVPAAAAQALAAAVELPWEARPLLAADLHVTLVFLGEVADGHLLAIEQALEQVRAEEGVVRVEGPLAAFGSALVAEVCVDDPLVRLQAEVAGSLRALGLAFDERPWRPHVTLARGKGRHIRVSAGRVSPVLFQAENFVLYRSQREGDARYGQLRAYPLNGQR